jgi:hypothetical protein
MSCVSKGKKIPAAGRLLSYEKNRGEIGLTFSCQV